MFVILLRISGCRDPRIFVEQIIRGGRQTPSDVKEKRADHQFSVRLVSLPVGSVALPVQRPSSLLVLGVGTSDEFVSIQYRIPIVIFVTSSQSSRWWSTEQGKHDVVFSNIGLMMNVSSDDGRDLLGDL